MKTNIIFNIKKDDIKLFNKNENISNNELIELLDDENFNNLMFIIKELNLYKNEANLIFDIQSDLNIEVYTFTTMLDKFLVDKLLRFKEYERYYFEKENYDLKLVFEVNLNDKEQ